MYSKAVVLMINLLIFVLHFSRGEAPYYNVMEYPLAILKSNKCFKITEIQNISENINIVGL